MEDITTTVTAYSAQDSDIEIQVTLSYARSVPWAVKATFHATHAVTWHLSRDLLVAGLTSPDWVGDCDVQFRRRSYSATDGSSCEEVEVHLHSPNGKSTLKLEALPVSRFLYDTWGIVPIGAEQGAAVPAPDNPAEL